MYVHQKIEFVTVNKNSLDYGAGKIVFHRSVVKASFVFRCLKTALHRLQLRIMSGLGRYPASISHVRLSGRTEIFLSGAPLLST